MVRAFPIAEKPVKFKGRALVTVRNKNKEDLKETIIKYLGAFTDKIGRNIVLQLFSTEIDPKTKAPKKSNEVVLRDWLKESNVKSERVNYTVDFIVDSNFGKPDTITVINNHQGELKELPERLSSPRLAANFLQIYGGRHSLLPTHQDYEDLLSVLTDLND